MGEIYANNAKGKLALAVSDTATTLELEAGHKLPALATGDWFRLTLYRWEFWGEGVREYDHEVVKVTAVATNTLTVERALEGTAQAFEAGTNAELRPTAGTVDAMRADAKAYTDAHSSRTDNPHAVTAAQVGADPAGSADAAETAANSYTDDHATETGGIHGIPANERAIHSEELRAAVSTATTTAEAVSMTGKGAIVESGSTPDGHYVRWENGEQVCWGTEVNVNFSTSADKFSTPWAVEFIESPSGGNKGAFTSDSSLAQASGSVSAIHSATLARIQVGFTWSDSRDLECYAWGFWK